MSLAGKLISAAFTIGTAAAVGYGLKKLEEKVKEEILPPEGKEREILGTADSTISLIKNSGGNWQYSVKNKGIVKAEVAPQQQERAMFDFMPVKDGITEIEFDYFPQGSENSTKTITYTLEVKDGKIIRCDAAGDLEMRGK